MALALAIIVGGGLAILLRLHLLEIAVGFWLAFAGGIAVLAAAGHEMTARWHLGPITGWEFWSVLVFSPEILVFLFFMITDPKTIPEGRLGRRAYGVGIGLLAVLLIAPQTTEFATKVAVLSALFIVCAAGGLLALLRARALVPALPAPAGVVPGGRFGAGALATAGVVAFMGLVVLAGIPARPSSASASVPRATQGALPEVTVAESDRVASELDRGTALQIAADLVADLRIETNALVRRDHDAATTGAAGARLADVWQRIESAGAELVVPEYRLDRLRVALERGEFQQAPLVVAELEGTVELVRYTGSPAAARSRTDPARIEQTLELTLQDGRYLIVGQRGPTPAALAASALGTPSGPMRGAGLSGIQLEDVASDVGLDFRHGAFRFETSADPIAMMGGGLCWLDYDDDGWLDLFVVNSYSIAVDVAAWKKRGGLPRSALFRNDHGRFADVSDGSGADVDLRGNGCVASDLNGDGHTDLYVTAAGYDALLWNQGDGTFVEGARAAGISEYGWHTGATVGDVNGDGRPDLFVAGYADLNAPVPGGGAFPTNYAAVRDRLYLNVGPDRSGRARFREIGLQAGIEKARVDHGLGALFTDVDGDGRVDLYVANDMDPNRLYRNVAVPGGAQADPARLGFRLVERGRAAGVADRNAGMGIAAADFSGDGRPDLLVTNSHRQLHGVFRSGAQGAFTDARPGFAPAFDTRFAGWGVAWTDLDLDGTLDVVLTNGAIPVTDLAADAEPIKVLARDAGRGARGPVADVSSGVGLGEGPLRNGRGLAAADYDNDGDVDVAVGSVGDELVLLENAGAKGHWLEVQLRSFSPGATVTVVLPSGRRLVREVQAGTSYLSSEDPRVHFGLGRAATVRSLVVRYPDGHTVRRSNVPVNRIVTVSRSRIH
jgi:hypothetical protein